MIYKDIFFAHVNMSYYQLNREKLMEKAKDRHHNGAEKKKLLQR